MQVDLPSRTTITTHAILAFKPKLNPSSRPSKQKKRQPGRPTDFTSVTNILMVALSDGTVNFYESSGELITSYSASHVVKEAVFDGAELPMLATAGTDGTILFHNMTLWRNNVVLVGRR